MPQLQLIVARHKHQRSRLQEPQNWERKRPHHPEKDNHSDYRHRTKETREKKDSTSNIAGKGKHQEGPTKVVVRTPKPKLYSLFHRSVTNRSVHRRFSHAHIEAFNVKYGLPLESYIQLLKALQLSIVVWLPTSYVKGSNQTWIIPWTRGHDRPLLLL